MLKTIDFNFEGQKIRSITDEKGGAWFIARDVMSILDIKYQAHALRKLDDDERSGVSLQGEGGNREFSTVNESGLYKLIFSSQRPEAAKFKKWVTSEVLPSIRKTGQYSLQPYVELTPMAHLKAMVSALEDQERKLQLERERHDETVKKVKTVIHEASLAKKENDSDTLTSDQISELDQCIHAKARALGDIRIRGLIQKTLKERFFKIKGTRTWKEIRRSDFNTAKQLVNQFTLPNSYFFLGQPRRF